jgi:hypothetical protein
MSAAPGADRGAAACVTLIILRLEGLAAGASDEQCGGEQAAMGVEEALHTDVNAERLTTSCRYQL